MGGLLEKPETLLNIITKWPALNGHNWILGLRCAKSKTETATKTEGREGGVGSFRSQIFILIMNFILNGTIFKF